MSENLNADTEDSPPTRAPGPSLPADTFVPETKPALAHDHAPARSLPGYQIIEELGRGAMGVVYRARQIALKRDVALKMILSGTHAGEQDRKRFMAEAETIASLHHPGIVQIHDFGTSDGLPYFAMEFCTGGTLAKKLGGKPLEVTEAARLVAAIAQAVQAAHDKNVIHRDLKPGNVLLANDGTPKVADFGLARRTDESSQTQTGVIVGTPSYMAPEQACGVKELGPACDVWALGAILYECLTGKPPFLGSTPHETLMQVIDGDPMPVRKRNPAVPRDLEAVCLACLEKAPKARYQSAADLADDLGRWLRGESVRARGKGVLYRLSKRLRKHRRKAIAVLVLALLLPVVWIGLADADVPVPGTPTLHRWIDRREASLFRPSPSADRLRVAAAEHRRTLRQYLLGLGETQDGRFAKSGEDPEIWTQMQSTVALLGDPELDPKRMTASVRRADQMFEVTGKHARFVPDFGFQHPDGTISAEPLAWSLHGLAYLLSTPELLTPADRKRLEARFAQVQATLDKYRSRDKQSGRANGGWTLFAKQDDPGQANVYITLIVSLGLLRMQSADLMWQQSSEMRDHLLDESLKWLLSEFEDRGWSTPSAVKEQFNDSFTLQAFTLLLQAEAAGRVELPDHVRDQIPRLLAEVGSWPVDHQSPVAMFSQPFRDHQGKSVSPVRPLRPVWYGWAVGCAACWLRRCERVGAPRDEMVRTRRVLGHLLVTLGEDVVEEGKKGYTFIPAEMLIGLGMVERP